MDARRQQRQRRSPGGGSTTPDARRLLLAGGAAAAAVALQRRRGCRQLHGHVVLVTGGSRGLGLEIARECVRLGARVAICGRDPQTLEKAREELSSSGGTVMAVPCDVADRAAVQRMVADVTERLGPVDVLVANAGIITVGPVETQEIEDFRAAMDVMYWGAVNPVLAVLPGMRRRGGGCIAIITSIGGKVAVPHLLPYAGAKFAAVGFAEGLHAEVARDGVRVTTIVPGTMRTGSHANAMFKGQHRKEFTWFALSASLPLISVDGARAARRVMRAIERGEAEVHIGLPAMVASRLHGLFPATTTRLLAMVDRILPDEEGGIGTEARRGADSGTAITDSPATLLGTRAAEQRQQGTEASTR